MTGRIHSLESFGTVDGPGIRYVVFTQGCPMRCIYCHNPDTWDINGGREVTVEEILSEFNANRDFYAKGGITVTGGEPLLQMDFLTELFKQAKSQGIHTCIDTSGITFNPQNTEKMDTLMSYTDLVMLDIKHIDNEEHIKLTGKSNTNILQFAKYLEEHKIPLWVRHIIVEGITDKPEYLTRLGRFIGSLKNLSALDVLPYHTMGVNKYKELGIPYKLEGVPALPLSEAVKAKQYILQGIREVKNR
ncbi:MAG: pyruvate formate-lyase-activating protein [Acutalibacteraceae bacterium]|nr:pyruvate formate-lyase-activating protein [Acutalibacteraceae bacterium]